MNVHSFSDGCQEVAIRISSRRLQTASMKGPLESRHTSSERSTPGLQAIRACAANGCANGRPSVPSRRLRAPDVCSRIYPNVQPGTFNLRLDHSGRHSELD